MAANIAKLVYFEKWMNGHAVDILDRRAMSSISCISPCNRRRSANERELQRDARLPDHAAHGTRSGLSR